MKNEPPLTRTELNYVMDLIKEAYEIDIKDDGKGIISGIGPLLLEAIDTLNGKRKGIKR